MIHLRRIDATLFAIEGRGFQYSEASNTRTVLLDIRHLASRLRPGMKGFYLQAAGLPKGFERIGIGIS